MLLAVALIIMNVTAVLCHPCIAPSCSIKQTKIGSLNMIIFQNVM